MTFVLEAGDIQIQVLNSLVQLRDGLLERSYFFVIEIIIHLKISLQAIDNSLILRNLRPEILRLRFLFLEPEIQIQHKLIIILALNLLIVHDIIHLIL